MTYFNPDFLSFFKELASNNHKDWFDKNRDRYEKEVKSPMQKFVQDLITEMAKKDKSIKVGPKDCIFRINKDIRFSKDKTPNKINTSAIISPEGRKNKDYPGLYIELGPEHLQIYQGAYNIETPQLEILRKYLLKNLAKFNSLVSDKNFKKIYKNVEGEDQIRLPKEIKDKIDKQPLLSKKQFYWGVTLKPEEILKKDLIKTVIKHHEVGKPLVDFLVKGLGYK